MLMAGIGVSSRLTGALSSLIPKAAISVASPLGLIGLLPPALGVRVPVLLAGAILVFGFGDAAGVAGAGFDALFFDASAVLGVIRTAEGCYRYGHMSHEDEKYAKKNR